MSAEGRSRLHVDATGSRRPPGHASEAPLLQLVDLGLSFPTPRGAIRAVDGVSLTLRRRSTLGIVGESGSGKSALARAIVRIHPPGSVAQRGQILLEGRDLAALREAEMRCVRGREIAIVFQDPMSALNPVKKIGKQIAETVDRHLGLTGASSRIRALELMHAVGLPAPESRFAEYPMSLSGGMRQRIAIAMALAGEPKILIADEPTTALDVTVQSQILELLRRLQTERDMAILLITHNLGIVASHCDETAVMYAGKVVERARTYDLLSQPRMPYTAALIATSPRLADPPHTRLTAIAGIPPNPLALPRGCRFFPRCGYGQSDCAEAEPPLAASADREHLYACWHPRPSVAETAGRMAGP
ncbi:MAG: ABC transporter ATP-binding protein [Hyphomicrobiales bacterium]|nr:ABC transporter ATP-binding protein [Hyphomicrobiales bacterium]